MSIVGFIVNEGPRHSGHKGCRCEEEMLMCPEVKLMRGKGCWCGLSGRMFWHGDADVDIKDTGVTKGLHIIDRCG